MNSLSASTTLPAQAAGLPYAPADAGSALRHGAYFVLDQLGLIEVDGADAASFLHNLLTNDIQSLSEESARLAGFCTPKGRLLASFLVWREPLTIRLLLSAEILAPIQKRLSMFVLRAKAKLSDISAQTRLVGLTGDAEGALQAAFEPLFGGLPTQAYEVLHGAAEAQSGALIRLPDAAGLARYLWAVPVAVFERHRSILQASLTEAPAERWDWLAIQAAEPRIVAATQEKFVPQMINFEAIGGVNFKKGCYPGQEIVARSQYLGTLKRRAMIAHVAVDAGTEAGGEVFHSEDPDQPCGTIINSAPAPDGGRDCLVEIKLNALKSGSIHLGSAAGARLAFGVLPYALQDQDA